MRCIFYRQTGDKRDYKIMDVDSELSMIRVHKPKSVRLLKIHFLSPYAVDYEKYFRRIFVDDIYEVSWYEYHHCECQCPTCIDVDNAGLLSDVEVFERAMLFNEYDREERTLFPRWDIRSFFVIFACKEDLGDTIIKDIPPIKKTYSCSAPGDENRVFVLVVEGERRALAVAKLTQIMGIGACLILRTSPDHDS